ncbi:FabD/lysophospholipase-like protein [Ceratobasidium sp. AG-I]|nr:FabD/lysophospholipase-like protein [Ceratobasidium sp. AG-I]
MSGSSNGRGIRALSLDGGYVNVLSALIILREFLRRIQEIKGLPDIPFPFECFDIMAGTGMGGVMLLLMGRLSLSIDNTLQCCVEILERVFKSRKWMSRDSVFSATTLETVVGEIIARHCGRVDARMMDPEDHSDRCKVMVCARTADAIRAGITTCIRTYRVSANQGPDCTIVEAVRATTATPGMFKRAQIKEQGVAISYVGGGLECNNPTEKLLADISLVFPEQPIACVVSIGCGQQHSGNVPDANMYDAFLPSKLLSMMQRITTDCERTHQDLASRFEHAEGVYFRFNTEHGMQDVNQSDAMKVSQVQAHAQVYLRDVLVSASMGNATRAAAFGRGLVTFQSGNIISLKPKRSRIGHCPPPSRAFTGREDILDQMQDYFFSASPMDRRLFVLCGLGGAGKTQLALKFVQLHKDKFWDVFYIDVTTRETISSGLIALARAAKAGETPEAAMAWLVSQEERWLLILNNADNPKLNLHEFFPACSHGDILITTRNQQMRAHTQESKSYCGVAGMLPEDALALMLKVSGVTGEEREAEIAIALAKDFGYFALVIAQAGAYIRATQCGINQYQKLFQAARGRLLRERGVDQTDEYGMSVVASWEISYRQLSSNATRLLHLMSFLHHEGISETLFEVSCVTALSYKPLIPLNKSQASMKSIVFELLSLMRTSSGEWNLLALKDLTNELRVFSLLDYDAHSSSYSMHPLVQEWCRTTAPDAGILPECAAWLLSLCVGWKKDSDSQALRRQLWPHALALGSDHTKMVPEIARNLNLVYHEAGSIEEYEALVTVALLGSQESLGSENPITLGCMQNLATAFRMRGKLEESVVLLVETIEIEKRVLGHEHPDTLNSMYALALTYGKQERWHESEALCLEVIEARKRVIGAEHRHTLNSMGALAWTYFERGRLSEAEALYVEVVEKVLRVMGSKHPDTLMFMHSLAMTYKEQGKLREAESLMEETVALRKRVLGESHRRVQDSVRALESIQRLIQSELISTRSP